MKSFTEKESLKLYGQIVEDFVNAQDSDEAYQVIIQGLQKEFNFPSSVIEKAIKYFPSLKGIASNLGESLSEKEMELLKLYPKYNGIRRVIDSQINRLSFKCDFYDPKKDKLVVYKDYINIKRKDIYIDIDFEEKNKKAFLKQFEKHKRHKGLIKSWQEDNQELLETVKKYRELFLKINELSDSISEIGHSKLKKIHETKSIVDHEVIIWLQKMIQIILTRIMKGISLWRSIYMRDILEVYNERYEKNLVYLSDGTFSFKTAFSFFYSKKAYLKTLD